MNPNIANYIDKTFEKSLSYIHLRYRGITDAEFHYLLSKETQSVIQLLLGKTLHI